MVSRKAKKAALLCCQNTEKGMLHCPLRGPSWPAPPQGSIFETEKLCLPQSLINLYFSLLRSSVLKITHLLLAYGGALPSPSNSGWGRGTPQSSVPGPATPGWSLFGAAQLEPEPCFFRAGLLADSEARLTEKDFVVSGDP